MGPWEDWQWLRGAIPRLIEEIREMATDFTQAQANLDAAIATVAADVKTLLAKVTALPPDQQAEVAAEVTALQASSAALAAIDTSVNPAPPPPPVAPPPPPV